MNLRIVILIIILIVILIYFEFFKKLLEYAKLNNRKEVLPKEPQRQGQEPSKQEQTEVINANELKKVFYLYANSISRNGDTTAFFRNIQLWANQKGLKELFYIQTNKRQVYNLDAQAIKENIPMVQFLWANSKEKVNIIWNTFEKLNGKIQYAVFKK